MIRFAARKKIYIRWVGGLVFGFVLRSFGFKGEFCPFVFHGSLRTWGREVAN